MPLDRPARMEPGVPHRRLFFCLSGGTVKCRVKVADDMNSAFPRILTLLRKERGISQKQAALSLGVSQALLSHYEKGIRECGLEFVVRAADFYHVSCDYLLGRTPDKAGAVITVEEIPDNDPSVKENRMRGSILPVLSKKLIVNSLHIIFDLLQRCNNKAVTNEISAYLSVAVYTVFRQLYTANPKNPAALFSVPAYRFEAAAAAQLGNSAARLGYLARGNDIGDEKGLDGASLPPLTSDALAEQYPLFATSLMNLLRNAEGHLQ